MAVARTTGVPVLSQKRLNRRSVDRAPLDCLLAEPLLLAHTLPQADDFANLILQSIGVSWNGAENDEPRRIRTEIDDGDAVRLSMVGWGCGSQT